MLAPAGLAARFSGRSRGRRVLGYDAADGGFDEAVDEQGEADDADEGA
jgi:hypothetical protein